MGCCLRTGSGGRLGLRFAYPAVQRLLCHHDKDNVLPSQQEEGSRKRNKRTGVGAGVSAAGLKEPRRRGTGTQREKPQEREFEERRGTAKIQKETLFKIRGRKLADKGERNSPKVQ